ncbi:hypothetical protein GCM10022222_22870 [Amycolatopsis ultiminotia]|uniref:Uncharacterized protein n=1 Tax=Amycolatopsis ultiminotia TaxID=543629 RepID=A0ABP6VN94_9PSEU
MNQCTLLDQILAGQGYSAAHPTVADPKRSCRADKSFSDGGTRLGLDVVISLQDGQKYTDDIANPQQARSGKITGRPFIEQRDPLGVPGGCQIGMAVGSNARALVIVSTGTDSDAACKTTEEVASSLEPKLPKN